MSVINLPVLVLFFFSLIRPPPISTLFPYTTLFRSPYAKWFVGGKTNVSYNCLDHQIAQGRGEKTAILMIRSEEHTSELQSHSDLVCRLLLEKKNRHSRCWYRICNRRL